MSVTGEQNGENVFLWCLTPNTEHQLLLFKGGIFVEEVSRGHVGGAADDGGSGWLQ
ncbi:hypothetical protein [Neobacillus sp. SuZ13]|uniref:hypothetical protein n=1 Tax=Neobacillus sp. SuZ13 TaxID=3047875 RepID=UPI0024BFA24B|nr:hypothetical protein [Neobacillus sp. SuZ13]WHY66912.1 hypothetical protein QNH17_28650 [Neobacillus sp. SuZ13]